MRDPSTPAVVIWSVLAAFALAVLPLQARTLNVAAAHLHHPLVQADAIRLSVVERGASAVLHLSAGHLAIPRLALAGKIEWRCDLAAGAAGTRSCSGPIGIVTDDGSIRSAGLVARIGSGQAEFTFTHAGSRAMLAIPLGSAAMRVSLQRIPAEWIGTPLIELWPGGEVRGGLFDIEASLQVDGSTDATIDVAGLAFNTRDGSAAGDGVDASATLRVSPQPQAHDILVDARLHGGTLRAGVARIVLPDSPVHAQLDAHAADSGYWEIRRFAWRDPQVLELEATAALDTAALAPLRSLRMHIGTMQFPQAGEHYLANVLAAQGLAGLSIDGMLTGELDVDARGLRRIDLASNALDVGERGSGIAVRGLRGRLAWSAEGTPPATRLAWKAATITGVHLPAAATRWQCLDAAMHLRGTLRTSVSGATVELSDTVVAPFAATGERFASAFSIEHLGHDSADRAFAVADLGAAGEIHLSGSVAQPHVRSHVLFHGGELLAGPVYVKLPKSRVKASLDARLEGARWIIDAFEWNDPGTVVLIASGELATQDANPVRHLRIDLQEARLEHAIDRYARSWLAAKGYAGLSGSGVISGHLGIDGSGLRGFTLDAGSVRVDDGADRFAVSGLDGRVDWDADADRPQTTLAWQSAALFGIPLGPARASLVGAGGALTLARPLAVDVLGGRLQLEKLRLQPRSARGERYAGSFAIVGIDMTKLSEVLGWPRFAGNLSGGIPEIEFAGDRIELHGGLDLYVFDGHLGVSGLVLERPFGVAPSLQADIHFENFDLDQLTSAFAFGSMSGRLNGTIGQLRLVDWRPVAMDARLRTAGGGRMSYNAVNDLTAIGGGGLSANLQTMALKMFDSFGYSELGIRCRLRDDVCSMGGIDPLPAGAVRGSADSGYTIVKGSGLPRITIVGHRRLVDWPTLVRRLREATQGQGPVVK